MYSTLDWERDKMSKDVLVVKDLNMHYETLSGKVSAVKNVSFSVKEGESFGLVGESGCGKTSVAMSLLQLQADNAKIYEEFLISAFLEQNR